MIEINNVSKEFKKTDKSGSIMQALNKVDFRVADGEIVALLGTNGSGKSTLLKIITGIIRPTHGYVKIDGMDSYKNRKKLVYDMGVVFSQKSSLIPDLTVEDNLHFYSAMYDINKEQLKKQIECLDKLLGIKNLLDKPVRRLSFGQRMKSELASILIHKPKYILLDEPTIGLDIFAKEEFLTLLKKYNKEYNATIIITTHEIEQLDMFCDRVVILDSGQMVLDKSPAEIQDIFNKCRKIEVVYRSIRNVELYESFRAQGRIQEIGSNRVNFTYYNGEKLEISKTIFDALDVIDLKNVNIDLKEALKRFYETIRD